MFATKRSIEFTSVSPGTICAIFACLNVSTTRSRIFGAGAPGIGISLIVASISEYRRTHLKRLEAKLSAMRDVLENPMLRFNDRCTRIICNEAVMPSISSRMAMRSSRIFLSGMVVYIKSGSVVEAKASKPVIYWVTVKAALESVLDSRDVFCCELGAIM